MDYFNAEAGARGLKVSGSAGRRCCLQPPAVLRRAPARSQGALTACTPWLQVIWALTSNWSPVGGVDDFANRTGGGTRGLFRGAGRPAGRAARRRRDSPACSAVADPWPPPWRCPPLSNRRGPQRLLQRPRPQSALQGVCPGTHHPHQHHHRARQQRRPNHHVGAGRPAGGAGAGACAAGVGQPAGCLAGARLLVGVLHGTVGNRQPLTAPAHLPLLRPAGPGT